MTAVTWMLGFIMIAGMGYATWRAYGQWSARQRAAEERMASFVAQARTPSAPAAKESPQITKEAPQERLLFDAAAKAAQAGEPVLSIQLYARLLSRFPQTALAGPARAAVDEQKKRLSKA
jgi:hypothetical protein